MGNQQVDEKRLTDYFLRPMYYTTKPTLFQGRIQKDPEDILRASVLKRLTKK